ncbi:FAD-dependent oxidoreductase [Streptomyces sp. NBC_00690]|uniref:FAD-dependent oxidoreductase n=1 Tax=Streptomyces sp. NBC_00690 TaxID=2975808 RepID=UPI002E2DBE66|nr:NAD(P)/FAD-dependent oxidoreductase [Streptomyces sp. NBC_00690]
MNIVIVGAGMAGTMLAIRLARRGHWVDVVERRGDPRGTNGPEAASISVGLSERGRAALHDIGLLEDALAKAVPMSGRIVHHGGRITYQPYGADDTEVLHSVRRHDLNIALLDAAESVPRVRLWFGHRVTGLAGTEVQTPARTFSADLVVGADGAYSTVRSHLHRQVRAEFHQTHLDWGYREFTIPAVDRPEALHVWPGSRGLVVAHPNPDGSLTGTVFLPFDGDTGFSGLSDPARAGAFLAEEFGDLTDLVPDLVTQFLAHEPGSLVSVRTAPWQHDRVVLVGDAAHAVFPFYGQGMNAAFEDCAVLDACLAEHTLGDALAAFEARRRPHTDVLAELSARNFVELRDQVRSPVFLARKRIDFALGRLLPGWRTLYAMISHSSLPYGDALARARRQDRLLGGLLGLGAVTLLAAARRKRSGRC